MMAAVKVLFWRGTDPQNFCLLLIWPCTKFHAFVIKCTIFSHIRPTIPSLHIYVGSDHFLGFKFLNFNIFGGFQKKWGGGEPNEEIVDSTKLDYGGGGHF